MKRALILGLAVFAVGNTTASADVGRPATRELQWIWKQDRAAFGAKGQPMPQVIRIPRGQGYAGTGDSPDGTRAIYLGPMIRKRLASKRSGFHNSGVFDFEHELARVYQPDWVMSSSDPNAGAGVANAVANHLARIRNTSGSQRQVATRKAVRYNRNHLPYFGQNPRSIMWPVESPWP